MTQPRERYEHGILQTNGDAPLVWTHSDPHIKRPPTALIRHRHGLVCVNALLGAQRAFFEHGQRVIELFVSVVAVVGVDFWSSFFVVVPLFLMQNFGTPMETLPHLDVPTTRWRHPS